MNNKFKLWFWLAVGLQIFIIAAAFAFNQLGSFFGENVLLKLTTPKDPLSLFQGHYLILDYEISSLDLDSFGGGTFGSGDKVFVGLGKKGDFWQAVSVSKNKPKDENVYIEGEAAFAGWMFEGDHSIRVNYGIEKYFIPEKDWQRVEDIMRKAAAQGIVAVQVSISPFNHKGSVKKIFINGEEFKADKLPKIDKLPSKTSSGESYSPLLKAKDTRIISALSQSRTVMAYTYSDDNNYDNFSCEQSDQINICRDVSNTGGFIIIAKNPAINSNSACAFSAINNPDTPWYCVDSSGRAGFTTVDPGRTGYCLNGKSAVCPRLAGEEGRDVPALRPISPVFETGSVSTTSQVTVAENKSDNRSIKIVFPNGGESCCLGGSIVIQWRSEGVKAASVSVIRVTPQYNIVSYNLSDYVFAQSMGGDLFDLSVFSWKVGDFIESSDSSTAIKGGNYRIKVDSNDNASQVYDVSDKTFVISECR